VITAACLLLALYTMVHFYIMGYADSRYFSVHIFRRLLSAWDQCFIEFDPNSFTESKLSDILTAIIDESHPGVPTAHKNAVTDTELTAHGKIETEPVPGQRHIVFVETRCVLHDSTPGNQSGLFITKREACAVVSAANTNPDTKVYLLYTCSIVGTLSDSPEYVKQMLSYPSVRIWKLVVADFIKGTPLENWDFMGKIRSSNWPSEHASDILRYTVLWKYGGTYLDLDFVMQK
jgi:hypothetical protein